MGERARCGGGDERCLNCDINVTHTLTEVAFGTCSVLSLFISPIYLFDLHMTFHSLICLMNVRDIFSHPDQPWVRNKMYRVGQRARDVASIIWLSYELNAVYAWTCLWHTTSPWAALTLCRWPCQRECSRASIQNRSFRSIWLRAHSNHMAFTSVCLFSGLAPGNGNWQPGFRCKYKCHCNYGERNLQTNSVQESVVVLYVCVCVCERERERECREIAGRHIVYSNRDDDNYVVLFPLSSLSLLPVKVTDAGCYVWKVVDPSPQNNSRVQTRAKCKERFF